MGASQQCKEAGLKNLKELILFLVENDSKREYGRVSCWLQDISKTKPRTFKALIAGCVAKKNK